MHINLVNMCTGKSTEWSRIGRSEDGVTIEKITITNGFLFKKTRWFAKVKRDDAVRHYELPFMIPIVIWNHLEEAVSMVEEFGTHITKHHYHTTLAKLNYPLDSIH